MFYFKGISSKKMKVIIEEEEHFLARASQRVEVTEIEGKDGAIYDELGYSVIDRPITVQILDSSKLDDIFEWLNGSGELIYNDRKTTARFYEMAEPIRNSSIKIIDMNFNRDPFWYKIDDEYEEVTTSVTNEGNIESRPIIKLVKNDEDSIDITLGGVRFIYNFNGEEYVEIDCEEMTVLYEGLNRNRYIEIDYDFPKLDIGDNEITVHSGDASIYIKRKDRWL